MCGFFQVIERHKVIDKAKFLNSLKTMKHRGPDATGHHFKEVTIHDQTYSCESRSPFLDYELNPLMYSGYQRKFNEDWNKHELRKVFDQFTPLPTQWRKEKQGFRWDWKHFFNNNKDAIIEVVQKSEILKEYINKDLFCFAGKKFPKIFKSSVSKRFLGIAGIEYMLNQD